ncbi:S-layer homology domain-containing protein [Paenisporosarcina indica]|uniref:S-layer homology domain-containing protein n=1 Tax=Paenisporosarcina indica TaxID=650093 RepID=UPI00094FBC61|nr:S-layer homology domain-containing protein [Paenisporosarcina indica]
MAYQPKSYKKFVATAATATLVASVLVPTASAAFNDVNKNYTEAVNYLVENGIAKGKTDTSFGTDLSITRGDAAVMIANALKLDTTKAPASAFTDLNDRVKGAVNALNAKGIINGKSATQFAPAANITRAEMAKVIALAYKLDGAGVNNKFNDVNSTFDEYVDALVKNEITLGKTPQAFGATLDVTRGEFALFVFRAEGAPVKSEVTSVVEAKGVNAKTITLTFNNALDAKTLKNANKDDLITVVTGDKANAPGAVTQSLSADGKTLTLTATTFFKGDYTVKVPFELVKDVKGKFVTPANQKVSVNDTAAPVLESAKATVADTKNNIKTITLSFNEDVKTIDTVKINGANYSPSVSGNTATVAVDLDATKSYDVTVVNATDVVGNLEAVQAVKLALTVDNIAPSVTNVVATGENTATVTVDKALKGDTLSVTGKVGVFNTNIVSKVTVNPKNNKEFFVTFNDAYLFKSGNSDVVTLTVAKEALEDTLGNKNTAEITKTVSLTKDALAPTVSKVATVTADNKVTGFTVEFNEDVQSVVASNIAVVNSKGEILPYNTVIASASIDSEDESVVNFVFQSGLKADKYSFELATGFVTDKSLAANKNAKHSFTLDLGSVTAPIETSFVIANTTVTTPNVLTVDFGTKVKSIGTGSALNPAAYQVNGSTLPADTKIAFAGNVGDANYQSVVNITLPAGFVTANDAKAIFRVTGVQSLDNKVNSAYTALVPVVDNAAPEAKSFVATDLTKLTISYSEAVSVDSAATISDEIQLFDTKGAYVPITSHVVTTDGKLVLTVADATTVAKLTTVKVDAANADITDVQGNAQKAAVTLTK